MLINTKQNKQQDKIRVCAYARVSTKSEEQQSSYALQKEYWEYKLKSNPKYEYVGMFADSGKSGKSIKHRAEFIKMIDSALNGYIDKIFVKSISRFSRNTLDTLKTIRQLKEKGVEVYFELENIATLSSMSDIMLTTWSALAEQQLQEISQNQKWSARKRFAEGRVELNGNIYGYDVIPSHGNGVSLVINEVQAKGVRLIYQLYLSGMGICSICKELENRGIKSPLGKDKWRNSTLVRILKNEKNMGDSLLQKSYNENFKNVKNNISSPTVAMRYIENTHEPIIDRATFNEAQNLMASKYNKEQVKNLPKTKYPFSEKLFCKTCGGKYNHRLKTSCKGEKIGMYVCGTYKNRGKAYCNSHILYADKLNEMFLSATAEWRTIKTNNDKIIELETQLAKLKEQEQSLLTLYNNRYIAKLSYDYEVNILANKILTLNREIENKSQFNLINIKELTENDIKYELVSGIIYRIEILDWQVKFIYKNGVEIMREWTNNRSGHAIGWNIKK